MSLRDQSAEIRRLISAFEGEAAKFHDIRLRTIFVTQSRPSSDRKFISPNHTVMLWQYYGRIGGDQDTQHLVNNIRESDLEWALRGAEISSFAVIDGAECGLFVRMARRAGSLFDEEEARTIRSRVVDEILLNVLSEHSSSKPAAVT